MTAEPGSGEAHRPAASGAAPGGRGGLVPRRLDFAGAEGLALFRYFDYIANMRMNDAIEALGALAHETRLRAFRLLVRKGPEGLPAGAIAARLGANASTMSHHLAILERAGLLRSWRVQRQIFYAADFAGMRGLLTYLTEDCCRGLPEIAAPAAGTHANEGASR